MEENKKDIPDGWHLKQVQEFALKMRSGGTPKSDNPRYYSGEIPFVAIDDLTSANKYLKKTQKHITNEGLNNSAAWLVPVKTIMYSIYATLGVPRINLIEAATNQAILNIIPDEGKITLEFLYYLLLEKRSSILAHSAHTTQSNLNAKIVKELEFIFPKKPCEQTQIATILSKVDEAIAQTKQLIAKYTRIKTGLMQDLLTKGIDEHGNIRSEETHEFKDSPLGRIPKDWHYCRLDDALILQRGFDITTKDLSQGKIPIVSSSGITGYHNKHMVKGPGVVTGRKGTIGKVYYIESDFWPHDTTLWVKDFKKNYPFFIYFLLDSINLNQFEASTANPTLNRNAVHPYPIVIPISNEEQKAIAKKIASFNKPISENRHALEKLKVLKTGLMQDLLSGKVRVNHLINETASV